MGDITATTVSGINPRGYRRGATTGDPVDQYVVPVRDRISSYTGRGATFRIAGNAAATQQNLLSLYNGGGATLFVSVNRITVDLLTTAAAGIAPSIVTPVVRVRRLTAAPSAGTALTKVSRGDSAQTSNASVTLLGGSSADAGTITAITATNQGLMAQKYAPRLLVVGTSASTLYEPVDTIPFFYGEPDVLLKNGEGLLVSLETHGATGNPATNFWIAEIDWEEWTRP